MAASLGSVDGVKLPVEVDGWLLTEEDFLLFALLTDPIFMPEILWKDPANHTYAGCYRVRDYQYQMNRCEAAFAIFACGRSVGKTEGEKVHAQIHGIKSEGENLLLTAPELIHLLPVTDAIEDNIRGSRLLQDSLDKKEGRTGFTHRPFGVNYKDNTKIVGRIPKLTGTGVKGQHEPFLIVEEGQDYPDKGWKEVEETVNYDAVDKDGKPRYRFWVYGVHSGDRKSGFAEKAKSEQWKKVQVTRLMRPDWGIEAKQRAKEAYGSTSSGDYRRNILGEPGDAASAYFVTARLMSCVDQQVERGEVKGSDYNTQEYLHQVFRAEELDEMDMKIGQAMDLPGGYQSIYGGVDVGLNRSPTVISLFTETMVNKKLRLKLFRRFTLERFRSKQIREALYAIDMNYGGSLMQIGVDSTGLGLPIMQEIEDDEICPPHLMQVIRGYFFGSKVPVAVAPAQVYKDDGGVLRDQYGSMVKEEVLPNGTVRFVVYAPFITASTRYLSEWVDSGFLLLPFDTEITTDMLGETKERVERIQKAAEGGNPIRKPDIFHILDSFRAMAMAYYATDIEEQLAVPAQRPVLDTVM